MGEAETTNAPSDDEAVGAVERYLVGVDGSDNSAVALRWAIEMASASGAEVAPVCAWHVPRPVRALVGRRVIDVDREGIRATTEVAATEALGRAKAGAGGEVRIGELQVIEGYPDDVLRDLTAPERAVVVGRRGVGTLRHRVLGSVSQYLATHASGPVVIVPERWEFRGCRSLVVGFDGSDHARAALAWALANAPPDAQVTALIAIDVIPWLAPELVTQRRPEAVDEAERAVRTEADRVDPEGRAERTVVLHGPRQALAEAMRDADLIVVGPRGVGAVSRAFLGSVTTWLLHDAPCPVAIVPG